MDDYSLQISHYQEVLSKKLSLWIKWFSVNFLVVFLVVLLNFSGIDILCVENKLVDIFMQGVCEILV